MKLRRSYPREVYLKKRAELHQLVNQATRVKLSPEEHNISGEASAPIIYLDGQEGPKFAALDRSQFDCREIKLINPTQPALALRFTVKHKYQIDRKPKPATIQAYLLELMIDLKEYLEVNPNDDQARVRLAFFRSVSKNPGGHEIALSNYFRFYRYPYVNYRYADGQGYSTGNTHLIASYLVDEDEPEEVDRFPRYNVIFIDVAGIGRPRPANDHARAEAYLKGFDYQVNVGKRDLFIKAKKVSHKSLLKM